MTTGSFGGHLDTSPNRGLCSKPLDYLVVALISLLLLFNLLTLLPFSPHIPFHCLFYSHTFKPYFIVSFPVLSTVNHVKHLRGTACILSYIYSRLGGFYPLDSLFLSFCFILLVGCGCFLL